ncbi:hypothetical protein K469DRAFT_656523 [Zopfia rhizophila CBS 207.26]|uniref:USP domain-containing protein n=1 Tax=Zopfia rhizophila CBS 207.26 TaxID=1314779 RepID=A0A6A6EKR6_9PEZI|nr:hypothetical protein K469DRAFT_656523 [Zopfia rhizophila CBS 207.26]
MSQQDHDLMESVSADDQAISVPASPLRRDSMEDADSSLTRKRPRLDSGSRDTRSMSTDPAPPADNPTLPSVEPVMTINTRPQLVSLQPADSTENPNAASAAAVSTQEQAPTVVDTTQDQLDDVDDTDSPPVIAVEDDDTEPTMDDYTGSGSGYVQVDHDEEDYFLRFPFTHAQGGNYVNALRAVTNHFQGAQALDGTALPMISQWLDSFPNRPSQWMGYYIDKAYFWEDFAALVNKVLMRRFAFGEAFCDDHQTEDEIFYSFFRSYLRLCARLLHVDAEMISKWSGEGYYGQPVLIHKHLRLLFMILRPEKSPVFNVLAKEYGADTRDIGRRLIQDFIEAPTNGVQHLFRLADAACDKITPVVRNTVAQYATQIFNTLGWSMIDLREIDNIFDRHQFYRNVLLFFRRYNKDLQNPAKISDVGVAKDLVINLSVLLLDLCHWDEQLAADLADEFLGFRDPDSPSTASEDAEANLLSESFQQDSQHFPGLVSNAWKFKLLKKYVLRGRMELRVMSIGTMDNALVEIWRDYNNSDRGTNHPIMQYLADFLLHEKVIDYIISVDSHPQLISRSGNIVGFLVVTHRYSESQTDAIWNTVSNSPDPRVVSATMAMLRSIVGLMDVPELLYLCTKLHDLPIESYTIEILRFLREVSPKIQARLREATTTDPKARPSNVCTRVIQDTSPSRTSTKLTTALHNEASEQFRMISSAVGTEERYQIYEACAKHIANRSDKATGSVRVIFLLCSNPNFDDSRFFRQNLEIARQIIEELCAFIEAEKELGPYPLQHVALLYRLEMLCNLVISAPESIPSDLFEKIWDHLVGKYALNNSLRDLAWARLCEAVRYRPMNEFFKQLISVHVPKLEPLYFTAGLYDFVANITFPITRLKVTNENGDTELLQIPGADLLWPLVLTAPRGTIEDRSARLLASRYIDIARTKGVTFEEVEQAHVALVEQCTKELLTSYNILRRKTSQGTSAESGERMDIVPSEESLRPHELRFTRTLLFEKLLLTNIRTKPEFSRSRRSDSKCEVLEQEIVYGDAIEVKYQAWGGTTNEKQSIFMGTENTLQDLYTRLCHLTGFTKLNIFCNGKKVDVTEIGQQKIVESLGNNIFMLVQKAPGSETVQPVSDNNANCSVFESSVLKHFEELFACMDSDDHISEALFDFLSCFPYRERIADAVITGEASADDIFPPGKIFQAKYAAFALQFKLREQLRRSNLNEIFLANAIHLLDSALLNHALISSSLSGRHELHLAAVLVNILLEFLKERPLQNVSSRYFSNEPLLVDRLLTILSVSLKAEQDSTLVVSNSYATILEASLHSRKVWDAFVDRVDICTLHQALLLTDPRKVLRENIAQSIASVCGGDLPSTSPLTGSETAARFWSIISSILPEAVRYSGQSEQLFEIAEQVFRSHDENNRDEESLRSSLVAWSALLLNYKHDEFVGRDEVDFVVLGFTKLLLCCIPSLKSFKKPLDAGRLMENVFRKFLFVPAVEVEDGAPELPVLESKTRKELYDLMLALAEDRSSYDVLLGLAEGLISDEESMSLKTYSIDRANEIRSPTGYVGLVNPRAICYMNSLLTQLFMNVNFRKFMLQLNVADAGASQRLLSETQKLFAIMQNTFRKAADPRDFAACVKGLNSEPIDINIQMDADEFYNLLFDQWEGQMLSPETKQRFRSFYGGQTVNQIKSKECEHVSERVESFFVVQCDVQGKANLQESLQAFVEGDVMEGDNKYKCESCGGKFVDAVKRTCLKDVPDNLIFHLKRFDFDLVDMRRTKINDLFEFPTYIDVSLYNVDHLSDLSKPRQEDIFELVGVLVHQGTSENGHYYSYIRERPCPSGSPTSWVDFNDRDVDPFDHQTIPYQAFGGWYDEQFQRQQKQYSAYMLFYQRRSAIEKDHREYISSPHCGPPKVAVPPSLAEEISRDNEIFVRDYGLYDPNHSKFIRQILTTLRTVNHGTCSEDHHQETQAIHIVLEHLNQVISRLRNIENFDETIIQLRKTTLSCTTCCHIALKWLATHDYALVGLLLRCPHMKVRSQVRTFLIDNLRFLRDKDPALYGVENVDTDMETGSVGPIEGILVDITRRLKIVSQETWISVRGWDDFYLTLCQLSNMGHIETAVILNEGFLDFCLLILCMHANYQMRMSMPDIWRLVEKKKNCYNRMIELVYTLLSKIDIRLVPLPPGRNDRLERLDRITSKFPLSHAENYYLHYWHDDNNAYAVFDRMIEQFDVSKTEIFYPGEVVKWMLQSENQRTQDYLFYTVSEGVGSLSAPFSDPYVRAAVSYVQGCPEATRALKMIDSVAKSCTQLNQHGGEVHLLFFNAMLTLQNEAVFDEAHPDIFYDQVLLRSRSFAISLLMYDDDNVRKAAARLIEEVFLRSRPDNVASEDSIKLKYNAIRRLVPDMARKIHIEHDNATSRTYMQPMIGACQLLMQILLTLVQSQDPAMEPYKSPSDITILQQYQLEVESRLRNWVQDEGTPISTGGELSALRRGSSITLADFDSEAYEHSDYGSESDEGPDLEP